MKEKETTKPFYNATIPGDWEEVKIKDVADVKGGFAFDSSKFKGRGKYQVIKMSNLYENTLDLDRSQSFLNDLSGQEKEYLLNNSDILITLTGTIGKRDYGYSYQVKEEKNLLLNQRVAKLTVLKADPKYIFYEIKTKRFLNQFFYSARGGTGNQANVGTQDLASIKIALPPLPEQKAIAHLLGIIDNAINTNNQLIAQKELRKKWLMQNLLAGKKRLKGFHEEWKEVTLGKIFNQIKNVNDGGDNHSIMTISSKQGLISQEDKFDRVIAGDSLKKYTQLKKEDFAYNKGNSKTYPMGCIYQLEEKVSALVPFVYICFTPTKLIDVKFYKHWFLAHGLDRQLNKIITSGARGDGLLNVNANDFFNLKIIFPPKEEQTAIAQVLQAADKEIQLLKTKTEKLREQKKGMMQVLLTGKKRLKIK